MFKKKVNKIGKKTWAIVSVISLILISGLIFTYFKFPAVGETFLGENCNTIKYRDIQLEDQSNVQCSNDQDCTDWAVSQGEPDADVRCSDVCQLNEPLCFMEEVEQ